MLTYRAQLEPPALLASFLAHPPRGFTAQAMAGGLPTFVAPFDLLTTADATLRGRLQALPGQRLVSRLWRWRTRFVGCTSTEFAPLPLAADAAGLAREVLRAYGRECRLLVVKDLAHDSPLLGADDNAFCGDFARALVAGGCVLLEGMALAYVPIDFHDEAEYLSRLSYSRRKELRRKLRARRGLRCEVWHTGGRQLADPDTLARMTALYRNVFRQSQVQFDELTPAFLTALLQDRDSGGVVLAYFADDRLIGWNLCYEWEGRLVDKYVGFAYPEARQHNLYFVSWMQNLEYARGRGLTHYVAGWTDTAVKRQLGAHFCVTRHAIYLRNPLLRAALRRLAHRFEGSGSL